jgi:hypothetical protein
MLLIHKYSVFIDSICWNYLPGCIRKISETFPSLETEQLLGNPIRINSVRDNNTFIMMFLRFIQLLSIVMKQLCFACFYCRNPVLELTHTVLGSVKILLHFSERRKLSKFLDKLTNQLKRKFLSSSQGKGTYYCNLRSTQNCTLPERIELFTRIEDQGFSLSYCLAPPPPPPPSPVSKLSLFLSIPVCRRSSLLTEKGRVVGKEPNHTNARKPSPL